MNSKSGVNRGMGVWAFEHKVYRIKGYGGMGCVGGLVGVELTAPTSSTPLLFQHFYGMSFICDACLNAAAGEREERQ